MSVARKIMLSSGLLIAIRLFQRFLGLISTLVLARLLAPHDFGVVAVAVLIVYFAEVLSNSGIQQYLVQVDDASDDVVNTAWTLDILLKVSICIVLYLALPGLNLFYDDVNIIYAVGALIPIIGIRALTNPDLHIHRRNLSYKTIFKIGVIQKLISFIVVLSIAFRTNSFWAMIVGDLVSSVVGVLLSYLYCSRKPRLCWGNIREQWNFSKWMLARGSVGYLRAQIDTLLVSQFYSLSLLGKFNIAREFTILPANEVVRPAVEPLLATFSMVKTDRGKLAGQVSLTLLLISCFTAPFVAFLFYFNGPIVFYLLGEQWSDAAPLMQAMTPLLFAFSLGGVLSNLCIALAKVRMVFFYDLISLFFISLVLLLAQGFSLEYFVWLRSFLALITVLLLLYYCNYLAGTSFMRQLLLLATPLLTAFALCSVLHFLFDGEGFIALILDGAIFFIIYFGIILYISHLLNGRSVPWTSLNEYSSMALNRVLFFLKNKS